LEASNITWRPKIIQTEETKSSKSDSKTREVTKKHVGKGQRQNRQPESSLPENKRQAECGDRKPAEIDGDRIGD